MKTRITQELSGDTRQTDRQTEERHPYRPGSIRLPICFAEDRHHPLAGLLARSTRPSPVVLSLVPYQSHPIPSSRPFRHPQRHQHPFGGIIGHHFHHPVSAIDFSVVAAAAAGWDILFFLLVLLQLVVLSC
ncbi:uncharacterized protein AKAW2_10381S [Aspergillus luchuensis]|uniref:Uncharacterized protein n=1 Tax=Aspergillus kawachii TaxID=1069201 RepID=A0A7R7ZSP7_ASPKA|nr:uncharacterized protein AKAW2_10381S [Aspergillus luchuensis]BCR93335.1 hypothetical protein AKAW2_10381S [Aspergillus luchuensis]